MALGEHHDGQSSTALAELVEKGAQDEIVRELLTHVVERLMEFEIEQRTGAEYGERTPERSKSRNGYGDRLWRRPSVPLICAFRSCVAGRTFRRFLNPVGRPRKRQRRSSKKYRVSRRGHLTRWSKPWRPLEGDWPYLWIDATYVKVRQADRIVSDRRNN